ncbi:MAG TPA: hypothetical protein VH599_07410 [Ktedonobacterales bacterium]|jgi:hypothetical protein
MEGDLWDDRDDELADTVAWSGEEGWLNEIEVDKLIEVSLRCPEVQEHRRMQRQLEFVRWLVEHHWLNEWFDRWL